MTDEYIFSCYASIIWRIACGRIDEIAEIFEELSDAHVDSLLTVSADNQMQFNNQDVFINIEDDTAWAEVITVTICDKTITVNDTYELEQFLREVA